jgi:haloalkane dehalogenase
MQKARDILATWTKPTQVIFATDDPILGGAAPFFRHLIPAVKEQPEISIDSGGHFLQDARGPELAQHVLDFIKRTPLSS